MIHISSRRRCNRWLVSHILKISRRKITTFFHPGKRVGEISERTKTVLYFLDIRSICWISLSHRKSRKHAKIWNSFYDRSRPRQRIDSSELCTCTARTPLHRTTTYCTMGTSCPEWATFCSIYPEFIARLSAKCRRSLSHHRNRSITFDERRVKVESNNERGLSIHRTLLEILLLIFSLIAPITDKTLLRNERKRRIFWKLRITT